MNKYTTLSVSVHIVGTQLSQFICVIYVNMMLEQDIYSLAVCDLCVYNIFSMLMSRNIMCDNFVLKMDDYHIL